MIQYFETVGVVAIINAMIVIAFRIIAPKIFARIAFRLVFGFTSCVCVIIGGCLFVFFELAFENWSALSNPAELLTGHAVILFSSSLLNLIAFSLLLIKVKN